jgi:hypothetical protein
MDTTNTPPVPSPTPPPLPDGIAGVIYAAGHFFDRLASACRATVQKLETQVSGLLKTETAQAEKAAGPVEAAAAHDVSTAVQTDVARAQAAEAKAEQAGAPAATAEASQPAVKAAESAR